MIMSLTVLSSKVNDNVEFSYIDGRAIINYRGEDALEGSVDLCMREVVALKAWCEQVIEQDKMR